MLQIQYWSLRISFLIISVLRELVQNEGFYKKYDFEQCSVFRQQGMYGWLHKNVQEHKHF
jgi:hypothetical protein